MKKTKTPQRPSSDDRASDYARRVVSGKCPAGPHVRSACKRHLDDLKQGEKRGLKWDLEAANYAIRYFETVLKLNGGDYEGRPFNLLAWQVFIVGSLFGWKFGNDRRFNTAYVETGKGSGKSPLAAGIGLYGLASDGEARAEVYAAATKKDQAQILFRDAVAMVDQSPELRKRITKSGAGLNAWNLAYLKTSSFFRPISSDENTQSGPRPHFALIDEYHEHKTNSVLELMRAGFKFRKNPLLFIITNSGGNKLSPCGEYHEYGVKVCKGDIENDRFFAYICALDEGEDPFTDEACWYKVNPSLQEANLPRLEYLRSQVAEARGLPSKEAIVRRLNFCEWVDVESPWLSRELWEDAEISYSIEELRGRRAWGGLDLSSTTDLTGFALLVEPKDPREPWRIIPFGWIPEVGLAQKSQTDHVPYDVFVRRGQLLTTPGKAIKKTHILHKIVEVCEALDVQAIAYDRWRIEDLKALAEDEGITLPLIAFGQNFKDMSPAVEAFEAMLLNGELVHDGNPVLTMCAANAVVEEGPTGLRKLNKKKSTGRIDLIVAAVMAAGVINHGSAGQKVSDEEFMEMMRNPL